MRPDGPCPPACISRRRSSTHVFPEPFRPTSNTLYTGFLAHSAAVRSPCAYRRAPPAGGTWSARSRDLHQCPDADWTEEHGRGQKRGAANGLPPTQRHGDDALLVEGNHIYAACAAVFWQCRLCTEGCAPVDVRCPSPGDACAAATQDGQAVDQRQGRRGRAGNCDHPGL